MSSVPERITHWVCVARVGEVPPGQVQRVVVENQTLVLVNLEGKYCVLDARCPHRGGPLDQGELWQGTLECPWHHFRFNPATGENVYPANVYPPDMLLLQQELGPARSFPVEVRADGIFVGLPASGD